MRVSFVFISNKDIQERVAERIRIIEHALGMEIQSFVIRQIDMPNIDVDFESLSSEEVKQALDGWYCEHSYEVRLEFREITNDE